MIGSLNTCLLSPAEVYPGTPLLFPLQSTISNFMKYREAENFPNHQALCHFITKIIFPPPPKTMFLISKVPPEVPLTPIFLPRASSKKTKLFHKCFQPLSDVKAAFTIVVIVTAAPHFLALKICITFLELL